MLSLQPQRLAEEPTCHALPRRLPCEPQRSMWSRVAQLFTKDTAPPLNEGLTVFCIAACRRQQTAVEAYLEGVPQGCLSYCFQQAFGQLSYRCTYRELCETMTYVQ